MKMNRFLEMAKQNALNHTYDDTLDYRLCAVIVSGGRILSVGFNKRSRNSFVLHFQKGVRDHCQATHAEQDAILRARKKVDLTGAKIYVVRIGGHGMNTLAMSRPCVMCENILYRYGITRAYYSIDENHYGEMKILPNGFSRDEIVRVS
jgi:deoxycytidylate deaminase